MDEAWIDTDHHLWPNVCIYRAELDTSIGCFDEPFHAVFSHIEYITTLSGHTPEARTKQILDSNMSG